MHKKSGSNNQQHNNQTRSTNQIRLEDDFDGWVLQVDCNNSEVPRKKMIINAVVHSKSITVEALADTGAITCGISDDVWRQIGDGKPPQATTMRLRASNNSSLSVLGEVDIRLCVEDDGHHGHLQEHP